MERPCSEHDSAIGRTASFEQLLQTARQGDEQAFGQLADQMRRYMLLVANRQLDSDLKRRVGASDLVQETLLRAQAHLDRFEGDSEAGFRAWLRQMVLNSASNARRKHRACEKRDQRREGAPHSGESWMAGVSGVADPQDSPSTLLVAREDEQQLLAALDRLRPRDRQVIELRNFERTSFRDIGARLDVSPAAARKLWLRALERLRRRLAPDGGFQP